MYFISLNLLLQHVLTQRSDQKSARKGGRDVTCVWCRSEWGVAPVAKPASSSTHRGGFVNLAGVVEGVDGRRDTTTCK